MMTTSLHNLGYDVRFALRQLRKHRGFTLIAVLTLGIGIGAATAVFSLVDAVLLRPLPFPEPDRIVSLDTVVKSSGQPAAGAQENYASWPDFFDLRRSNRTLAAVSAYRSSDLSLGRPGAAVRRVSGTSMSAGMAGVLGLSMQMGRDFLPSEELPGNRSIILSDGLYRSEFAGDPGILGKQIRMDGQSYTVVGILPRGFVFPAAEDSQFWVTEARQAEGKSPETESRGSHMIRIIGRLRTGVSAAEAQADLTGIQLMLGRQFPDTDAQNDHIGVMPLARALTGDATVPLRILLAAVVFLLLIACVNVAGLMLTRAVGRQGELAVRAALGASRSAILRQLLMEAMAVALAGGLAGTLLAASTLRLAPRYLPRSLPHASAVALDGRVLLFALAASVLTGFLFGVLPAWRASQLQPAAALQGNSRGSTAGRGRHRLHGGLVIAETALSMLLLVGAGLLLRSFERVLSVDPGFQTRGLLSFRVAVPSGHLTNDQEIRFAQQLQQRLSSLPGVSSSTYAFPMPLVGGNMRFGFSIEGQPQPPGEGDIARISFVAPNFFQSMGIPILRGRNFTGPENLANGPGAVIVNQAFANAFFPGSDPLNKIIISGTGDKLPIVGVVGNVKRTDLTEQAAPEYHLPMGRSFFGMPAFVLRTSADPMQYADTVRRIVAEQDGELPVFNSYSYDTLLERSTALRRFQTVVLSGFAAVALLLAAIGLYGSLSYMVMERTGELGLRMALGAQRGSILSLILRRGLLLGGIGLAVGLVASAALTRSIGSLLYHTRPLDLLTFAGTALLLLAVCALSSLVPALRASRLDPAKTLHQQ